MAFLSAFSRDVIFVALVEQVEPYAAKANMSSAEKYSSMSQSLPDSG